MRVNALQWAYSISTRQNMEDFLRGRVCQCPTTGLLHFYLEEITQEIVNNIVSMPYNGLIPFLPNERLAQDMQLQTRVNALQRAYSISTLKSGKPHK